MAQGYVYTCVEFDSATNACTAAAWMPAPSLFPPDLTLAQVGALWSSVAVCFAVAYAWRSVGRSIRD